MIKRKRYALISGMIALGVLTLWFLLRLLPAEIEARAKEKGGAILEKTAEMEDLEDTVSAQRRKLAGVMKYISPNPTVCEELSVEISRAATRSGLLVKESIFPDPSVKERFHSRGNRSRTGRNLREQKGGQRPVLSFSAEATFGELRSLFQAIDSLPRRVGILSFEVKHVLFQRHQQKPFLLLYLLQTLDSYNKYQEPCLE